MRILYIDVNCKHSSTGNIVYSLFSCCKSAGIESAVCYGRGPLIKERGIYKFGIDFETLIHAFLTRLTGLMGYFSFFSTRRLIRYIKHFKPDIIHVHELHAYFVNVPQLLNFLKKGNYKVIFTNHCEFLYTGKCGHAKECTRYSDKCGSCPHLRDYPTSLFVDRTSKMLLDKKKVFDGWDDCVFVSPSSWLDSKSDVSFLKNKKRLIVHNGIDTKAFSYRRPIDQNKKRVILSVAPNIMSDLKGGFRVLKLAEKFKGQNCKFVLVGATEKINFKVPDNVSILPLVNDKVELINLYNSADLFLICSSFENFPTTSLEAQCCGLPVCGFDVGGVKETILEGNGTTVAYGDYDALKDAIDGIFSKGIDHKAIAEKSINEFSNESMFLNYLSIYNKLT